MALHSSNGLLLTILFLAGCHCARAIRNNPWIFGSIVLLAGLAMVGITMALGDDENQFCQLSLRSLPENLPSR